MTLKFISIGLTRVPKGTFQVRIENPFPSQDASIFCRHRHLEVGQGRLAGESLNCTSRSTTYVHGTVANVNDFFREIPKLGQ